MPAPRLLELPGLLELPSPRVGLPGIGGNPAALPDEIDSSWTQLFFGTGGVAGSYHRPLDPPSVNSSGTSLAGWRRIGARIAAIGRVAVERESLGGGSYSAFVGPYGSSPFVPTDTNRPSLGRTIVTLEGAEGTSFGDWRLGVAVGYRAQENSSSRSAAAQVGRSSSAGLTLGAERAISSRARVGVYGRALQSSETVNLVADPQTVRVYVLDGFVNVPPADFNVALPAFLRREDRAASTWGADVTCLAFGASWMGYAERQSLAERQFSSVFAANPPTNRWHTSGYAVGGSAQRTVRGARATVSADWSVQRGDADRAETTTGGYRADASRLALAAAVRYAPNVSPWTLETSLSVGRDRLTATDNAARITTDITAWMPGVAVEVARRVSDRLTIGVAYGRLLYTPDADVPSPARRGTAYTLLLAPAIEVAAATARADQGGITARWITAARVVSFRVWASGTNPVHAPDATVPLPPGSRTTWGISTSLESVR